MRYLQSLLFFALYWHVVCLIPTAIAQPGDLDRRVSVTVDDLPATALFFDQEPPPDCDPALLRDLTAHLLAKLDGIEATGFVTEGRICNGLRVTLLPELLSAWLDAGHDLGNHTFSHHAFENAGRDAFEIDVLRGEATASYLLNARGKQMKYFRYPFLHAPADADEKATFEAFLTRRGYTVAPVTLDNDEWIYAWSYSKALDRGDTTLAQRIGDDYVRYMEEVFAFNEAFSRELLGRELPQILLIHANPLNADYFDELKVMIEGRQYRFISLSEAMQDEAYSRPDPYLGERGLLWLQRLAVGAEGGTRSEPRAAEWVVRPARIEESVRRHRLRHEGGSADRRARPGAVGRMIAAHCTWDCRFRRKSCPSSPSAACNILVAMRCVRSHLYVRVMPSALFA